MRLVIAEDSVLLRAGMARLLEEAGFEVVGQAGDGAELLRKVRAHRPDVAVVDIRMPPLQRDEGVRAAREIRCAWPEVGVLLLSQHVEEHYAEELLAHGAEGIGYLLKDRVADVARFTDAIREVAAGGAVLDPEVVAHMVGRRRRTGALDALSACERDVLTQIAQGASNRAIARRLYVSQRAVERHVTAIFDALGLAPSKHAHRRVLAVLAHLRAT
jgi:DNA-binding NarL/FixJ family response regulator